MLQDFIFSQKVDDYVKYLFPILDKMPKWERFATVAEIKSTCFTIKKKVIRIHKSRNPISLLHETDVELEMLRWLLRLCYTRKFIAHHSFETSAKLVDELGRILGGLLNSAYAKEKKKAERNSSGEGM